MTVIETLKEMILDFQQHEVDVGVRRRLDVSLVKGKAFVCIGVRRCGKSTLLNQLVMDALEKGLQRENVLYVNFFDDRIQEPLQGNLNLILEAYFSLYPEKKGHEEVFCFFDEIQEIRGWEAFVDRLMRTEPCRVFITGSSARMLSKEIATQMRGRSLAWELFPFSFAEWIDYKGVNDKPGTSRFRLRSKKVFEEYWDCGGFPEVRNVERHLRVMIHQEYFKTIVLRDIVQRYDASHPRAVMDLAHRLVNQTASLYSINSLTGYLKSVGHSAQKTFVRDCLQWFEDAYFMFSVLLFDASVARQNVNPKKIYCVDHALVRSVGSGILVNTGHLLENVVFCQLRRLGGAIHYYRTADGREVDFIWRTGTDPWRLVQVCETLESPETREREVSSLRMAMRERKLRLATIVTRNEQDDLVVDEGRIHVVPVWEFLLSEK
jgi:predicted AAA+ superfamily ATPase